jgi:hypothetical protein
LSVLGRPGAASEPGRVRQIDLADAEHFSRKVEFVSTAEILDKEVETR